MTDDLPLPPDPSPHDEDPLLRDVADRVRRALRDPALRDPASAPAPADPALRDPAPAVPERAGEGALPDDRPIRPDFRASLRAELVAARARQLAAQAPAPPAGTLQPGSPPSAVPPPQPAGAPVPITRARRLRRGPLIGWAGAAAAAAVAAAVVLQHGLPGQVPGAVSVVALSDILGTAAADPSGAVAVRFSRPLDHAATLAALHLSPAASLRTAWQGDTLTLTPTHGFAQNAAYVLTVDHTVARTTSGAPLAADLHVVFGTAPRLDPGPAPAAPVALPAATLAASADDSEAVVLTDGAVLLTSAERSAASGDHSGLVRITSSGATRIAPATDAICVSRSGRSVAFLTRDGARTQVVFADRTGTPTGRVSVQADASTPLGWIGDAEVSFVSAGRLRAVDRSGHVRVLADVPVDPAREDLAIAPGGRYVYLASSGSGAGRVIDLVSGASHPLDRITGSPAFSADGATVVWVQGTGSTARLAVAPSDGGPTTSAPLTLQDGDTVSDLAVSPDGSRLVYSVVHRGATAELRLASLPDGDTLAVSTAGTGESPNWAPSGDRFTVLAHVGTRQEIKVVRVPTSTADRQAAWEATARAFANAQLGQDAQAQAALTTPGVPLPSEGGSSGGSGSTDRATRASVLWVLPAADGTATARIRLTVDPTPQHPVTREAVESLTLSAPSGSHPPTVTGIVEGTFAPAPDGPSITHVDTDAVPGSVLIGVDSDLDPTTVASAVSLVDSGGAVVGSTVGYDPATRTITLRTTQQRGPGGADVLRVGTGLRDVAGHPLAAALQLPLERVTAA